MANRQIRILLVEDSRVQRQIVRAALARMGHKVDDVESAEAALALYAPTKYDTLLVDVMLPGMGGVELLGQVRQRDSDQCVILMTAAGSGLSAIGAIRAGADDYVTKPIRLDDGGAELEVIISRSLERRRLARENRELQARLLETDRLNAVMSLAGAAAHEMNQPLTVLIGTVELLIEMPHQVPDPDDIEAIHRSALRIAEIVDKLRSITSYETKPYSDGIDILDLDRSATQMGPRDPEAD